MDIFKYILIRGIIVARKKSNTAKTSRKSLRFFVTDSLAKEIKSEAGLI